MSDDDIDVKAEGKKLTERQQQGMRTTAADEEYARKQRTQRGWNKRAAQNTEIVHVLTSEPNSRERIEGLRRDEYLLKTTGDDVSKKHTAVRSLRQQKTASEYKGVK